MKGFLKMETKTYLIKTKFDYSTKELVQDDPNSLTIQFKIMDKYAILEIVGKLKDRTIEEFTHQIICNKDQDITILPAINDQVALADNIESVYQDRVFIDRGSDIISSNDLSEKNDKTYQLGLHGQLDLEDLISEKEGS